MTEWAYLDTFHDHYSFVGPEFYGTWSAWSRSWRDEFEHYFAWQTWVVTSSEGWENRVRDPIG